MTITANAIIKRAMRLIRALAAGETPKAGESQDCLTALNAMVDSWLLERLTIPQVLRTTKVLTASTQDYTIGAGGNINIARPLLIQDATLIPAGDTSEIPLAMLSDDEWALQVGIKSQTAQFPMGIYYNYGFASGLGTISVWPIPLTAPTLVLYTPKAAIANFAALATSYEVPPGYERAIAYNLAVEIAPEFYKPVPEDVLRIALDSKANIKRANIRMLQLGCDAGVLNGGSTGGAYNWKTDQGA